MGQLLAWVLHPSHSAFSFIGVFLSVFSFSNSPLLTMGPLCGLPFPGLQAIPGGAHGPRPPAEVRKP
ncbi:hypothetical protein BDV27DRAFT_139043 [Aspergillus caelatus]|uniref:Uncharacterized protein n=1 Tax=Aspergillus caelatus TaxID=61420 RepID=A0A5N6ZJR3_9EURO|nr:uncharacterized protein BDV27DRAFT_139043 [Aspergillus caelatus]KAE8357608.1 hypothetical protein BDV27DRAFT_139043 [Aspergillus caelatus]